MNFQKIVSVSYYLMLTRTAVTKKMWIHVCENIRRLLRDINITLKGLCNYLKGGLYEIRFHNQCFHYSINPTIVEKNQRGAAENVSMFCCGWVH